MICSYPFNNIQRYNESAAGNRNQGFVGATSIAEALVGGRGYFTYMNAGAVNDAFHQVHFRA